MHVGEERMNLGWKNKMYAVLRKERVRWGVKRILRGKVASGCVL